MTLATTGFEAEFERLKPLGVALPTEPEIRSGNKAVFFSEPVGTILHLIERAESLP